MECGFSWASSFFSLALVLFIKQLVSIFIEKLNFFGFD
jgi:hypothetical protein